MGLFAETQNRTHPVGTADRRRLTPKKMDQIGVLRRLNVFALRSQTRTLCAIRCAIQSPIQSNILPPFSNFLWVFLRNPKSRNRPVGTADRRQLTLKRMDQIGILRRFNAFALGPKPGLFARFVVRFRAPIQANILPPFSGFYGSFC